MKNLQITITLEKDRKTINLVDIDGSQHYFYEEDKEEQERYQNMTVAEFIAEYVKYYESVEEIDLSTFVLLGNNRLEAYAAHMDYEMGFDNPDVRELMSFDEFCKELEFGYGNSGYIQIARLYEDKSGKIWYDNEYAG